MYKALRYLFGYRKISFANKDTEQVYNFLYNYKITSWGYSLAENEKCSICISNADYSYFLSFKDDIKAALTVSDVIGMPQVAKKYKNRIGIFIGAFLFLSIIVASSLFIWDVRIIGAKTQSEAEIIENLKEEGLYVGKFIPTIKSTEICNSYIMKYDNIGWMSINTKGNVANVEIIESVAREDASIEKKKYANLVAVEDAIIEEVKVSRGSAVTKVGKTVKKGELLISGVYESPRRYSFVYASGSVLGRVNRTISIEIPFVQTVKEQKNAKLSSFSVNFFNFKINIFRYSGKMPSKYDTIYRRERITLFDKIKLPIFINREYFCEYEEKEISLSENEAVKLAFSRLKSALALLTYNCELISKSIEGELKEGSYVLNCDVECIKDVAIPLEFETN
jgi:similar to stage IV sporulation protein